MVALRAVSRGPKSRLSQATRHYRTRSNVSLRPLALHSIFRDLRSPCTLADSTRPICAFNVSGRRCRSIKSTQTYSTATSDSRTDHVFIALGSNVGNSVQHIEAACDAIDDDDHMRIVDTSCLYESKPMYVEDQDNFVNGACEIETDLPPLVLLDRLQAIEQKLGRVKLIDKGPRNIDLDIVGYADQQINTERLSIPHLSMLERPFVIRPLCDLKHGRTWRLPSTERTIEEHLIDLDTHMPTFTPLGPPGMSLDATKASGKTSLMSILNVTPDSFSDGGEHVVSDVEVLKIVIQSHIEAGAEVIDIGGQSSRPHASNITASEEIDRILPAVRAAQEVIGTRHIAISVDTYRHDVAEAAVRAGAHIINDISGGTLDTKMLEVVARLGCTYVIMHMRGTPDTMSSKSNCTYENDVIADVAAELSARVQAAVDAGIRRWRIVLDPGIGFAKDSHGNLTLLRHLSKLRQHPDFHGIPWLVGSSRKRFIGEITGVKSPNERGWGTAATVTAAIAGGAHMVRVHDVRAMAAVVKMSDAIYSSDIV